MKNPIDKFINKKEVKKARKKISKVAKGISKNIEDGKLIFVKKKF